MDAVNTTPIASLISTIDRSHVVTQELKAIKVYQCTPSDLNINSSAE